MERDEAVHKVEFDKDGNLILKKKEHVKRGGKSKAAGGQFELRVRHDLEKKGFIVDKWTNNIDLEVPEGKIIPAKKRMGFFGGKMRFMSLGTGFPDFICLQWVDSEYYRVIGVEVKMNGKLSKIEKEKCRWYLSHNVFSEILIARKEKENNRVRIVYERFEG